MSNASQSPLLETIINTVPGYVSWLSRDLVYLGVNDAVARAFGKSRDEFIGSRLGFQGSNTKSFHQIVESFFSSGKLEDSFEICLLLNGKEHWQIVRAKKYNEGKEALFIGIDITDRILAERELEEARKTRSQEAKLASLGEMSASIAHEINNPLTVVRTLNEVLCDEISSDLKEKYAEKIHRNISRIEAIIRTFRNFARNADQDPFETCSLQEIMEDVQLMCSEHIRNNQIQLITDNLPLEFAFDCRPTQIIQILANLVKNAIDAIKTLDERWIRLELEPDGDRFLLSVTDSGHGISEENQKKIFDTYFTTKKRDEGTGLGLSICQRLVGEHQGSLQIDSACPNTRFVLELPREQSKKATSRSNLAA